MREPSTMSCGIYSITNSVTGKVYIGSAVNFSERWRIHRVQLGCGKHHSKHLQSSWIKHGEDAFVFKELLICAKEHLVMYEQIMIDGHSAADRKHGYNARPTAESMLGYKHTPETKLKMAAAVTGRKASPETKALLSRQRTGRKMPEWFPASVSKRMQGFRHSDTTKAVISAKGVGRPTSLATREKKAKITFEQVESIKSRARAGIPQSQLASEFSLSQSAISLIATGKRWANLPPTNQEKYHG